VQRERVEDESAVPTAFMLDEQTGYVRITNFLNDRVADDLHDALGRLEAKGMKRLVLDLRDNPGGRVDQAAKIAGEFLPKGVIVYTSTGEKREMIDTSRVSRSFWRSERRHPIVRTPCGRVVQRQYRSITTREYYRLARADRDTAGRPSCRTDGGRVAYGGGGIYPDLVVDDPNAPLWLARLGEDNLVLKWIGGYVGTNPAALASLDALAGSRSIDSSAIAELRNFAAAQGVTIPSGADADAALQRVIFSSAARAKFGDAGYYRASALLDSQIQVARRAFDDQRFSFLARAR
jgi:hypothetical protein